MVVLGHNGAGRLELVGRYELVLTEPQLNGGGRNYPDDKKAVSSTTTTKDEKNRVVGYKFHKRLRVLPPKVVRKVKIRLYGEDDE
jgi:hypothetical protein